MSRLALYLPGLAGTGLYFDRPVGAPLQALGRMDRNGNSLTLNGDSVQLDFLASGRLKKRR